MTIKHSIFLPTGFTGELAGTDPVEAFEALTSLVRAADETGYESVWMPDHLHTVPASQAPLFEAWTTTAALLRETSRVRVGQLVTCNGYRNPALQAKTASTVDVLGGGRLNFGIGSGWYEPDFAAYGYEFPDTRTRLAQLEEAVQIIRSLWTEDETTFVGEHYQVRGAINQPKGVQRPHIPMMIAGGGEKVTLRLVAQYGEGCNILESPEGLAHKYAVLRRHCEAVGRDYESIRRTATTSCILAETDAEARAAMAPGGSGLFPGDLASYGLIGTVETIRERIAAYEAVGVQELVIGFGGAGETEEQVRRFAAELI